MAIDSEQRVEELEEAVERRAARPAPSPAPTEPAESSFARAARDRRRGDWAPFIVITALLAVGSMYVSYGQAQWFSVIGGILAMGALG